MVDRAGYEAIGGSGEADDDHNGMAVVGDPPDAGGTPNPLDQVIGFGGFSLWQCLGWVVTILGAAAIRLVRLDDWALNPAEATRAYDSWVLFQGRPLVTGESIPNTGALPLLLQSAAFFLFGTSDVVARMVPALAGIGLVLLPLALRRWVGDRAALGIAALVAFSPTMDYASRVVSPEITVALLALAALAFLVRLGEAGVTSNAPRGLAIALGVVTGAAYASGPSAITVELTMVVGIAVATLVAPDGTIARGLRGLRSRHALPGFVLAMLVTALLAFTRFLSFPAGIGGAGATLAPWWQLLTESGGQPVQLFLITLLIYEPIAVVFGVVALGRQRRGTHEAIALSAGWFAAAFAVWSFSAGRGPEHTVHVAVPLLLLGGMALGAVFQEIDWAHFWRGSGGVLALLLLGIVTGLAAVGILLTRIDDRGGGAAAALPAVAVLCLVVVPMTYFVWRMWGEDIASSNRGQGTTIALFVIAILLGAFGLRSANLLAFARADLGTELLAQGTATLGTLPSIERFLRLARDAGVGEGSARDPTGSHSLSIALERDVRWPYAWYLREFPDLSVVEPGTGAASGSQVVIAATDTGLAAAGYAVETWPWINALPQQYVAPDMEGAARALVNPTRWLEVWRFLLFRDGVPPPAPETVAVGLTPELAGRVTPATGPFALSDRPGPGTEPGQFVDPIGVAVGTDGGIAVVDSGNARVQRFSADGELLGVWGGGDGAVSFTRTENGLGPTGITVDSEGITWVADTWGHRVVALDAAGTVVQTIGDETVDIGDDPARVEEAGGRFFGPRDIAVSDDAVYVVDTGNERVQLFTRDGVFVAAWGGYGSAPDQLIEPVGVALGPEGNVYVADSGNARIAIFTPDGEPVAQWPVAVWPPPDPGGLPPAFQPYLAFDDEGNLYATASNAGEVLFFDPDGALLQSMTAAGSERLAQPVGVAVAGDGTVMLTDIGRDAVLEVTPSVPLTSEGLDAEDVGASPGP